MSSIIGATLNDIQSIHGLGSAATALTATLRGFNHQQITPPVPMHKEMQGYVFVTRPMLNMQMENISNVPAMHHLTNPDPTSIGMWIRATLDPSLMPVGHTASPGGISYPYETVYTPLVDPFNPFIPLFTNNLVDISGWPDTVADRFSHKPGRLGQTWSFNDSEIRHFGPGTLTLNIRNMAMDPTAALIYTWMLYMSQVFQGYLWPYPHFNVRNRIDSQCRIYRITVDPTKTYFLKIAAAAVAQPISVPYGAYFDYTHDKPFNLSSMVQPFQFAFDGFIVEDPRLITDFNRTLSATHPVMGKPGWRDKMVKLTPDLKNLFRFEGYPYLNADTREIEWFIDDDTFNTKVSSLTGKDVLLALRNS